MKSNAAFTDQIEGENALHKKIRLGKASGLWHCKSVEQFLQ